MPPQEPQNPAPQAPGPPAGAPVPSQPTSMPLPAPVQQTGPAVVAAPAAAPQPIKAPDDPTIKKLRQTSLAFGIISLVGLVAGFLLGYASMLAALLGIYGVQNGKKASYTLGIVVGGVGAALNIIMFILAMTILKK